MSDEAETTQRHVFLTTAQVKEQYGFDPEPDMERCAAGQFIFNKLVPLGGQLIRVWLESDVQAHPLAKRRP